MKQEMMFCHNLPGGGGALAVCMDKQYKSWVGIFPVGGCGIVEYCCVSGSLAYTRILYEQIASTISTLTHSTVQKISQRFAPSGLSILAGGISACSDRLLI